MNFDDVDEKAVENRLGKLIALAKRGVGGEQKNAERMIRKICKERGLVYEDVLSATDEREYQIPFRSKDEKKIVAQCIFKFAETDEIYEGAYRKLFAFRTTPSKYIETVAAIATYLAAFRKEKRRIANDMSIAFIMKHSIYPPGSESKEPPTEEEMEDILRRSRLAADMDDVDLHKQLES